MSGTERKTHMPPRINQKGNARRIVNRRTNTLATAVRPSATDKLTYGAQYAGAVSRSRGREVNTQNAKISRTRNDAAIANTTPSKKRFSG